MLNITSANKVMIFDPIGIHRTTCRLKTTPTARDVDAIRLISAGTERIVARFLFQLPADPSSQSITFIFPLTCGGTCPSTVRVFIFGWLWDLTEQAYDARWVGGLSRSRPLGCYVSILRHLIYLRLRLRLCRRQLGLV